MKKILMSVVGIGLGHATRSEAIYNELKQKSKVNIMSYGEAHNYFKKMRLPSVDFGGYSYHGGEYSFDILLQIIDFFKNPGKLRQDYVKFRKHANEFKPDVVFSDSEPNAFFYATNRGIPNSVLTNLITTVTHYNIIPKYLKTREIALQNILLNRLLNFMLKRGDRFFVPSFEQRVSYEEKVEYTDLIVREKPSELISESQFRKKFGLAKDFYYVHVGGADVEKYLYHVLENILPKFKDEFFVVSSNYATKKIVSKDNMVIFPFIKNSLEIMKMSKGVIAPAGHSTISEAIVYKKPLLAIPVRSHVEQLVNASLLKREGFGDACFFEGAISPKFLKESIEKFFAKRDDFEEILKKVKFKGEGAKQIAKELLR